MQKLTVFFLTIIFVVSTMTACGGVSEPTEWESETSTDYHEGGTTEEVNKDETTVTETEHNTESVTEAPSDSEGDIDTDEPTQEPDTLIPDRPGSDPSESEHVHNYSVTVVNATCTEKGYTSYTCECGDTYTDHVINAIGHRYGAWETTKEPTTASKGEAKRNCGTCGKVQTRELDRLDNSHTHSYSKEVVEPTCTERGYTIYTCSCGTSYTSNFTSAGHNIIGEVQPATCILHSYILYSCTRCDYSYADGQLLAPALGHDYEVIGTTEGDCINTWDIVTSKCKTCGEEKSEWHYALRHNYVEDHVVKEAFCRYKGSMCERCTICGGTREVEIPALGHAELRHERIEPTCGTAGRDKGFCSRCDTQMTDEKLAPLGGCNITTKRLSVAAEDARNLGNPAINYDHYLDFEEQNVKACTQCGYIDEQSMTDIYSDMQKSELMMGFLNDARWGDFGTQDYSLKIDETLLALAQQRVKEAYESGNYSRGHVYASSGENIGTNCYTVHKAYVNWGVNSECNNNILNQEYKYFAYATYRPDGENAWYTFGVLLFWTEADREAYFQGVQ